MTIRHIDDLLKHGDKDLNLPRPKAHPSMGKGFPEAPPYRPQPSHDPRKQGQVLWWEWLEHVKAGRIGRLV